MPFTSLSFVLDLPLLTFSIESFDRIKTHCSVKEFTAEEGQAYLPKWMMTQLNLNPGDDVTVRMVNLPEGASAKFKINKQNDLQYYNPVVKCCLKLLHADWSVIQTLTVFGSWDMP